MEKRLADIDELRKDIVERGTQLSGCYSAGIARYMDRMLAHVLDAVDHAPTIDAVPRWIPCKERLPEEYGLYLITTNDGRVDLATYGDTKDEKAWSSCDANGFYWLPLRGIEVIAWMLLPKSYEGERKDDER